MQTPIENIDLQIKPKSLPMNEIRQYAQMSALCCALADLRDQIESLRMERLQADEKTGESLTAPINSVGDEIKRASDSNSVGVDSIKKSIEDLASLVKAISIPEVKIPNYPTKMQVEVTNHQEQKDIVFPSELSVNNLGSILTALDEISAKLSSIKQADEIKVSNLNEIVIPKNEFSLDPNILKYLSRLELLSYNPNEGISVRLTDGQEFYKGMGGAVATAVGGLKDPTELYKVADVDDASSVKYYGFTRPDGKWMVMKEDTSTSPKTYRYCAGAENYASNFVNRAGLSYNYFHLVNI